MAVRGMSSSTMPPTSVRVTRCVYVRLSVCCVWRVSLCALWKIVVGVKAEL
jgi:hypothetical protein